jgi:dinuclear metal center YbgI/SA1388 family protein
MRYLPRVHRNDVLALLNRWLEPERFRDVAENGLQVEGKDEVKKVVCGVSANRALIEAAIEREADAIFVHHGLVWGGGIRKLTGWLGERVRLLMGEGVSLFAYHLPLDAHPELGNNAGLADALDLEDVRDPFGEYKGQLIGTSAALKDAPAALSTVIDRMRVRVGEPLAVFGDPDRQVQRVGVCTGGAPELLHDAIDAGVDLYVTGEVTEWCKGVAEEAGIAYVAGGHHATERFGAQRVAGALSREGLDAEFLDVENPA